MLTATLVRDGTPLVAPGGPDLSGLLEAEAAVAALAGPGAALGLAHEPAVDLGPARPDGTRMEAPAARAALRTGASPTAVDAVHRRLGRLAEEWRQTAGRSRSTSPARPGG